MRPTLMDFLKAMIVGKVLPGPVPMALVVSVQTAISVGMTLTYTISS